MATAEAVGQHRRNGGSVTSVDIPQMGLPEGVRAVLIYEHHDSPVLSLVWPELVQLADRWQWRTVVGGVHGAL
jgi:hypothetical protein